MVKSIVLMAALITSDPWIFHWDHSGFAGFNEIGTPAALVAVEYAATDMVADLNGANGGVIFNRSTFDLGTDWQSVLRAAGVDETLITQLSSHYRADLVTDFVKALNPGRYALWARVQNNFGSWSGWTKSVDVIGRPAAPDPPTNLRCAGCP